MIDQLISQKTIEIVEELYGVKPDPTILQIEKTNRDFEGDLTLIVFPLLRISKKPPHITAEEIGGKLVEKVDTIDRFNVVKGFLNLSLASDYWLSFLKQNVKKEDFGFAHPDGNKPVIIEYSSPNTNKPIHLGHIRNNLLGFSLAEILKANGKNVIKVNLINDRGIHICKSMLAWQKYGHGETPESSGTKGDHLVGKYYVLFDKKNKEEASRLIKAGFSEEDAASQTSLMKEAKDMLLKWEAHDPEVLEIWKQMNGWTYAGFEVTYKRLGVDFDQINYESETYLAGKAMVEDGLSENIFARHDDGSVWVDLRDEGLDEKLLLRSDGTSLYITQDLGTAQKRYDEFNPQQMIYVVGNEQIYHFDVLKKIFIKLGRPWFEMIYHLSYGMVELPHGRMKSREGTVVDADDLMDEMYLTAKKTTEELGKTDDFTEEERDQLYNILSLGALKYYILKVDPKKNMLFNPDESIDFNGNTGPFIQYTYARIQSIFRKAAQKPQGILDAVNYQSIELLPVEKEIIQKISVFPEVVKQAGEQFSPAQIANYVFDLVKTYNHFYQDTPILKRVDEATSQFRMALSYFTGTVIKKCMNLLGIDVPDKM